MEDNRKYIGKIKM